MINKSIVERIRNARAVLNVSMSELEKEMVGLYKEKNSEGVINLFEAYRDWEIRESDGSKTKEESIKLVKRNLDYICAVADKRLELDHNYNNDTAVVIATKLSKTSVGPVQIFYRNSIEKFAKLKNNELL